MTDVKGGYGIVYREIMRSRELTPEAKAIYAYLCSFAGSDVSCYPGVELMRTELRMGTDRFYKHMHLLTEKGIVEKTQERNGNRWGHTIYTLNHTPDFQLSQNEDTQKQHTHNRTTNNNSLNNNSQNNNSVNNTVNKVDHICTLLNRAKEKAGSKGRLKPSGAYWFGDLIGEGISFADMVAVAEELAEIGKDIDWFTFFDLVKERKAKGGI